MIIYECRLHLARELAANEALTLRDLFGTEFEQHVFDHGRGDDGRPRFEYPRVQFKVMDSMAVLLGINEGADLLEDLCSGLELGKLSDGKVPVVDLHLESRDAEFTFAGGPIDYRFVTPWLALNQQNFRSYTGSRNTKFRKDELSRILIGNCLGAAKSLGIAFPGHVSADCGRLTSIKTTLKGNGVIGFVGRFQVNLHLPELIGLGRSAFQGFGAVSCRP